MHSKADVMASLI